ncbi:MAG: hypothetical protein COA78_13570 [Blastopirellula sp.]|nr:MAG: hypothetical protein COA78_13570 [Blastopirellula sp.]
MTRASQLKHRFVENIPASLDSGVLYIAPDYATMIHLCCCGCGNEVVTPLSRKDWKFTFDGESVSVHPSVGSWSLPCKSHYIIKGGVIRWAGQWTDAQIKSGRQRDLMSKRGTVGSQKSISEFEQKTVNEHAPKPSLYRRLIDLLFS